MRAERYSRAQTERSRGRPRPRACVRCYCVAPAPRGRRGITIALKKKCNPLKKKFGTFLACGKNLFDKDNYVKSNQRKKIFSRGEKNFFLYKFSVDAKFVPCFLYSLKTHNKKKNVARLLQKRKNKKKESRSGEKKKGGAGGKGKGGKRATRIKNHAKIEKKKLHKCKKIFALSEKNAYICCAAIAAEICPTNSTGAIMSRTHTAPRVVNFFERKPTQSAFGAYHPLTNAWVMIEPTDFDGHNLPEPDQVIRRIPFKVLFEALSNNWMMMPFTSLLDLVKYMGRIDQIHIGKAIFPIYHKEIPSEQDYIDEYLTFPPMQIWIDDEKNDSQIEIKSYDIERLTGCSIWDIIYHDHISFGLRLKLFAIFSDRKHTAWGLINAIHRIDPKSLQKAILSCMETKKRETGETISSAEITQ